MATLNFIVIHKQIFRAMKLNGTFLWIEEFRIAFIPAELVGLIHFINGWDTYKLLNNN